MTKKINWDKQLINEINNYLKQGYNFPKIAKKLHKETGVHFNKDDVRLGYQRHTDWINSEAVEPLSKRATRKAFENLATAFGSNITMSQPMEIKKLADGSYSSSRTLELTDSELKDENALLKYHGYDPDKWTIKTSSNSRNTRETNQGTRHSYNSRITVKPKIELNATDIKQELLKDVQPVHVEYRNLSNTNDSLLVPLYDLHFGIADTASMSENLSNLVNLIRHGYKEIIIVSGGDIIHSDKVTKSETAKGTQLDPVNMKKAITDAREFYSTLFREALQNSANVRHYSISGNHDRDLGYMLNLLLEVKYPQVEHHVGDYRQAFTVNNTSVMIMHGDLATRNAPLLFAQEYRDIWNSTGHHQIISGHFHYEKTKEIMGVELIQVGTNKPNDPYESANGYIGNNKQLTAMTYNDDRMTARYYL